MHLFDMTTNLTLCHLECALILLLGMSPVVHRQGSLSTEGEDMYQDMYICVLNETDYLCCKFVVRNYDIVTKEWRQSHHENRANFPVAKLVGILVVEYGT